MYKFSLKSDRRIADGATGESQFRGRIVTQAPEKAASDLISIAWMLSPDMPDACLTSV
jgi:hypothetical protein